MKRSWNKYLGLALAFAALGVAGGPGAAAQEQFDGDALSAYLKGVYLESENDLYNAYQYYLYAAARAPHTERILLRLAKVATEIGDYEEAKKYCEELIGGGFAGAEPRMILAEVEYRLGDRHAALALLTELRAMSDAPRLPILKFLAKICRELGKPDDARKALEEASALSEADRYVFYELGVLYAEEGKVEKAAEALQSAIAVDPDFVPAHLVLAKLLMHLGRRDEGKAAFREALRLEPGSREAIKGLTDALYEDGQYAEGAALLAPLHQDGDLDEGGRIIYGRFLYKAGRLDEAIGVFNDLIATAGEKPAFIKVVAEMEAERGNLKTAFGFLRRLIEIEPERFDAYAGALLLLLNPPSPPARPAEAIVFGEADRRALMEAAAERVDSDSEDENYAMGSILRRAGEMKEAERFLLRAEALNGKNENTLLELATLYGRTGKFDDALARVVALYEKNPDDASLANFYGYLLAEKGERLDLAGELLARALAKEPQNGYFLDSLGWIRFKEGRFQEALAILLDAVEKAGEDAVIWEHIGDTYARLNESEKALEAYRKSLSLDPKAARIDDKMRGIEKHAKDGE